MIPSNCGFCQENNNGWCKARTVQLSKDVKKMIGNSCPQFNTLVATQQEVKSASYQAPTHHIPGGANPNFTHSTNYVSANVATNIPQNRPIQRQRVDKDNYYLDIAETVFGRCTCLRRSFGAIIVKNDEIISTGYNGAPRGRKNCTDIGFCERERLNVPPGQRYELCRSVHAEQNAIISAPRKDMIGSTMYLVGKTIGTDEYVENAMPCDLCQRFILNAGIDRVVIRDTKNEFRVYAMIDGEMTQIPF